MRLSRKRRVGRLPAAACFEVRAHEGARPAACGSRLRGRGVRGRVPSDAPSRVGGVPREVRVRRRLVASGGERNAREEVRSSRGLLFRRHLSLRRRLDGALCVLRHRNCRRDRVLPGARSRCAARRHVRAFGRGGDRGGEGVLPLSRRRTEPHPMQIGKWGQNPVLHGFL